MKKEEEKRNEIETVCSVKEKGWDYGTEMRIKSWIKEKTMIRGSWRKEKAWRVERFEEISQTRGGPDWGRGPEPAPWTASGLHP